MWKRSSIAVILILALALVWGCPASQTGTTATPGAAILAGAEQTKTVAEDILYYARVYQNMGKITDAQFKQVKDAYDILYVAQNAMIDARIAYLKAPADATADQKFRDAMTVVVMSAQKLTELAFQLGIIKEKPLPVPIRK